MPPSIIRQLWATIEATQVSTLLQFDDVALVQLLLKQFDAQQSIDTQVRKGLNTYIQSKLSLIRDTADSRGQ